MKTALILCALVAVVASRPEETYYSSQYDNFDADEFTHNDRLMISYIKCWLDQGPCTAEGKNFKQVMPEAIQTNCAKCTPKQKELIRVVVKAMQEKHPDLYEELEKKQDPEKKYAKSFREFISGTN